MKPQEQLLQKGAQTLSEEQLCALILRSGSKKYSVVHIANQVVALLKKQFPPSFSSLKNIPGVGYAKACQILSLIELSKRQFTSVPQVITTAEDAYKHIRLMIENKKQEHLVALFVNTKMQIIAQEIIFIGTTNAIQVHPREIYNRAMHHMAHALIIAHNHPSGDHLPSKEDITFTKRLQKVGDLVGIPLIDHIIVGSFSFWSFSRDLEKVETL